MLLEDTLFERRSAEPDARSGVSASAAAAADATRPLAVGVTRVPVGVSSLFVLRSPSVCPSSTSRPASTITLAIILAKTLSGEVDARFPGVAMRRAALGATGVTRESSGDANARGSPNGVSGSATRRGEGAEGSVPAGDATSPRRLRRSVTDPGVAFATASATASTESTPADSAASRAAFPGDGPGRGEPETAGARVAGGVAAVSETGSETDGSVFRSPASRAGAGSDGMSTDGDTMLPAGDGAASAGSAAGVPPLGEGSTTAAAITAARASADAFFPAGDLGGLRGLMFTGALPARALSCRVDIAVAASFAARASSAVRAASAASDDETTTPP